MMLLTYIGSLVKPHCVPWTNEVFSIIAVTGLAGHAYGSWAHTAENMWLRDYLPRDAPNARILTYGYDATLQGSDSFSTLNDYAETFWQNLVSIRDSGQVKLL
jgi:hypothetical protein